MNLSITRSYFEFLCKARATVFVIAGNGSISREHQVHPTLISKWQKQHLQYAEHAFAGNGQLYKDEAHTAELERMVGKLTMENAL